MPELLKVTAATAWARVETKKHDPSDILAGAAIGHFFGVFFNEAFLGPNSPVAVDTFVDLGGQAICFNLLCHY